MGTATFYKNSSDDRKLDKNLSVVTGGAERTVEYKEDTSIMNPVITVDYFAGVTQCNYVYLSAFQRYYFVRAITMSQQRIALQLEIDVLKTYASQIRKQTVIVKRQQDRKYANMYLDDDKFKALEYNRIQAKAFSSGFTTNAFILTIAGGR